MVNKLWCETSIPILWKNPWKNDIKYSNKSFLYNIITFYFTDNIKDFLLPTTIIYQSLLFDYLSFCRCINVNTLYNIISVETSSDYDRFLLQQELYNVIIRKCPGLKYLNMISIKHQIFYFPEAKTRLESLNELKCDTSTDSSYFYGLANVCQNIQGLIITNTNKKVNHGIIKLIEVQRNLKYFEWNDNYEEDFFIELLEDPYTEIFSILAKHANSLNNFVVYLQCDFDYDHYIHSQRYAFLPIILKKLHKLKRLNLPSFPLDNDERMKTLKYHDLERFEIDYININLITCIIKNSGGYLKSISIDDYYTIFDSLDDEEDCFKFYTYNL